MDIEFTEDELITINLLLVKEIGDTRVEIHHSKNHEYKMYLKEREVLVNKLIHKLEKALSPVR